MLGGLICSLLLGHFAAADQPRPGDYSRYSPSSASQVVRDPTTGKTYQQQLVDVTVPKSGWQLKTKTQKYLQPLTVTEPEWRKHYSYVPRQTYVLEHRQRGQWNPFQNNYYTYQYKPVVQWVPVVQEYAVPVAKTRWVLSARTQKFYEPVVGTEVQQRLVTTEVPNNSSNQMLASGPTPRGGLSYLADKQKAANFMGTWPATSGALNLPAMEVSAPGNVTSIASAPAYRTSGLPVAPSASPTWDARQNAMSPTVLR